MNTNNNSQKSLIYIIIAFIISAFLLIGLGVLGFSFYQTKMSKPPSVYHQDHQIPTKSLIPSPRITQTDEVQTSYKTITRANAEDENKTDVYIKKLDSEEETFLITLTDVYRQHSHNSEYHNGNLYIIRRIGYDGYPDKDWSDELWKYDSNQNGQKLYSSQGISFRVAANEKMIGIRSTEMILFIDTTGKILKVFTSRELRVNPEDMANRADILKWSSDNQSFWGWHTFGPTPSSFYEINVNTWEVKKYDVSELSFGTEGDLNTETKKVVYSNYPALYDVGSAEEFNRSGKEITLYIYDFVTEENKEIATSITKSFNPKWINNNSVEYDDPDGEGRLVYRL